MEGQAAVGAKVKWKSQSRKVAQIRWSSDLAGNRGKPPSLFLLLSSTTPHTLSYSLRLLLFSFSLSSFFFLIFSPPPIIHQHPSNISGQFESSPAAKLSPDDEPGCLCNATLSIERHIFRLIPVGQSDFAPPIQMQILLRRSIVCVCRSSPALGMGPRLHRQSWPQG